MWKQWKKAAVVLMACTMLLNMTGCKKQEEKLKEPQTEQENQDKRMKKRQRAKRKRFRRIKIC